MATTYRKRSDTEVPAHSFKAGVKRSGSPMMLPMNFTPPPIPMSSGPLPASRRRSKSIATIINSSRMNQETAKAPVGAATDLDVFYYRNAETRTKLKQYLATPQRFDEVLTYGFGSAAGSDTDMQDQPACSTKTSYESRSASSEVPELEDHVSFNTSDNGADSPATPADPDFAWRTSKFNRVSIFGGLDTEAMPSFELDLTFIAEKPESTPPATFLPPPLEREMTLRMTLTRPDLRATEEDMYGRSRPASKVETLAHSPLSTSTGYVDPPATNMPPMDAGFLFPDKIYEPSQTTKRSFMTSSTGGISRFLKKLRRS